MKPFDTVVYTADSFFSAINADSEGQNNTWMFSAWRVHESQQSLGGTYAVSVIDGKAFVYVTSKLPYPSPPSELLISEVVTIAV